MSQVIDLYKYILSEFLNYPDNFDDDKTKSVILLDSIIEKVLKMDFDCNKDEKTIDRIKKAYKTYIVFAIIVLIGGSLLLLSLISSKLALIITNVSAVIAICGLLYKLLLKKK